MAYENRINVKTNQSSDYPPPDYETELEGDAGLPEDAWYEGEVDGEDIFTEGNVDDPIDQDLETSPRLDLTDVTREQILQLYSQVEAGTPSDEGTLKPEEAMKILNEALIDEAAGRDAESLEGYLKVFEAYGIDPSDSTELLGFPASKVENGVFYLDGSIDGGEIMTLKAPGTGITAEVKNAHEVSLTPKSPSGPVILSKEGNFVIAKLPHEGKVDTFKVHEDIKLHINSNEVSGDVDSENVTTGTGDSKRYISDKKIKDMAKKIENSVSLVGYKITGTSPFLHVPNDEREFHYEAGGTKYTVGYQNRVALPGDAQRWKVEAEAELNDVKKVLQLVADAIENPELWEKATDEVSRWVTQTQTDVRGRANNRAAFLFNVLNEEIDLQVALEKGIIPSSFAGKVADALTVVAAENSDTGNELAWQSAGSNGWTHQSKADFLRKYAGVSPDPVDTPPAG